MFTKTDIEKYFTGEKQESLLFLGVGIAAVLLAVVFLLVMKTAFYKGAATPLLLIGLLLGVVGFTVYKRSDGDRIRNVYAYDRAPSDLKTKELPRMVTVMKNFVVYRYVEILLAIAGIVLFWYFRNDEARQFWKGLGCTLALMALIALGADYFAEKRGNTYINGLRSFTAQLPVA
jgi:ABC-type xylose transport system permease subunit